jgi:hypothetical protein
MSYEQKYLKYKQKYIDLKIKLRDTIGTEQADTILLSDTPVIGKVEQTGAGLLETISMLLSDTPTQENSTGNTVVEQVSSEKEQVDQQVEQDVDLALTETPVIQQTGGWNIANASPVSNLGSGVPNTANCPGNVNVQPSTVVPVMPQGGDIVVPPAVQAPVVAAPVVEASVVPAPATQRKNLSNNEDGTTTDLSEIRNTTDIEKIFSQLGGHEKDVLDSTSSSSIFSSDSFSESDSISDM